MLLQTQEDRPTDVVPGTRCTIALNVGINFPFLEGLLGFVIARLEVSLSVVVIRLGNILSLKESLQCLKMPQGCWDRDSQTMLGLVLELALNLGRLCGLANFVAARGLLDL